MNGVASPTETTALATCERLVHRFFERLDDADLEAAFACHVVDVRFFPPGARSPLDRYAAIADSRRMRLGYPGQRMVHAASGFIGELTDDGTVRASYLVTVYERTRLSADGQAEPSAPVLIALARERCVFRRVDGAWQYVEQRMEPVSAMPPGARHSHDANPGAADAR